MKFKYFIRGLGVGIVFATVILMVAYIASPNRLKSDEEIIARAKELGMTEAKDNLSDLIKASTEEDTKEATTELTTEATTDTTTTEATTAVTTTETTTAATTTEATTAATTTEATTAVNTTEATTAATTESTTTAKKPKNPKAPETTTASSETVMKLTIKKGMISESVSKLLAIGGMVDDAKAFNDYLNKNGYSTKLNVGEFKIKKGMSYKEIATLITK